GFFMSGLFGQSPREILGEATSTIRIPQAQLKIRSTLATLEDGAVNSLLSGLLGGGISLNLVGWQGVANADINLLQFLNNALGIDVTANIGTYQGLLDTEVRLGDLLGAMTEAVRPSSTANLAIELLSEFEAVT